LFNFAAIDKDFDMQKKLTVSIIFFLCPLMLFSKSADTDSITFDRQDVRIEFSHSQWIVPASLITIGVLGLDNMPLQSLNRAIRDKNTPHRLPIDDYTLFLPAVSIYGLDFLGTQARHNFLDRSLITLTAYATMGIFVQTLKWSVDEPRPDFTVSREYDSFPSGHTAIAFVGAEIVRREYWNDSPWYGIGAYAVALGTGFLRVYNDRHWTTDVIAGAGFGILSANIAYWLLPVEKRIWQNICRKQASVSFTPYYTGSQGGLSLAYRF